MKILNGKDLAEKRLSELKAKGDALSGPLGRPVGLAVILVGDDPASQVYVANKFKACENVGFKSFEVKLPEEGYYEVWARATDSNGTAQPMLLPGWNPKGYLNNASHRIAVKQL